MKTAKILLMLAAAAVGTGAAALAQTAPEQVVAPFSDPSRPGRLRVSLVTGGITVKAANRQDVLILARSRSDDSPRRDAGGLRRLAQAGGFRVVEENNEMRISTDNPNRAVNFEIHVPMRTNLKLHATNNGDVQVEGVDGEIEATNVNGSITLTGVSGTVVANTTNGGVTASLRSVTADKPMAFTSLNGNVDVTLPASTRATFKLRSDMGDVFSDFDVQLRSMPATVQDNRRGGGRFQIEVNKAIYGAVNGGGPEIELRTFNGNVYVRKGS
jgi:hypothetical protein